MALFRKKETVTTPKIHMAGVSKTFGKKRVLHKMDLDVYPGESLVIIGGSGTGKSVTLKCILGLLTPDSGKIEVDGKDILSLSEKEHERVMEQFGMLFQNAALFDSLTVWENVAFSLIQNQKINKKEAKKIAMKKLAQVGLKSDVANVYPADLSGGMRKRVGLARAIATNPEVIFFDEPTTGLDPFVTAELYSLIAHLNRKHGVTVIMVTHDIKNSIEYATKILSMEHDGDFFGTILEYMKTPAAKRIFGGDMNA